MLKYMFAFCTSLMLASAIDVVNMHFEACQTKNITIANRKFAFELFHHVADEEPSGNIFISPLVVSMGLSMLLEGARGTTRDQLIQGLKFDMLSQNDRQCLGRVYEKYNMKHEPEMSTAVKLFADNSMHLLKDFLIATSKYANNKLEPVDFAHNPAGARNTINQWVKEQTKGKIDSLFPSGSISQLTRLVLASALYFKAEWLNKFEKVRSGSFQVNETYSVTTQMMTRKMKIRSFYDEATKIYFVELPYVHRQGGLEVSMILTYDDLNNAISVVESKLTYSAVEKAISSLMEEELYEKEIVLPKFNLSASYDLSGPFQAMGMNNMFQPGLADFSGMTEEPNVAVSKALHKTFLSVDEHGSEAAAALGLEISLLSLEGYWFIRPFHFFIYEKTTNTTLFMGRVIDPSLS